ncbi:DUF6989 domain-containing protein [Hufsiella ginkgonis]|uniref:DUF6989 domain-containing protein n=1 Tax=Hufsiella ginkgonis TaxID=2695274 RepID=A0A7K1XTF6_9SPHI|nr:hypothetical protein [Hufsiella ginkgonis]MXV13796.1 hypothetical protein [Hufsiella ginkgonis]
MRDKLLQKLKIKEVRFIVTTLVLTVVIAGISAAFNLSWRSGFVLAFGMYSLLTWFAINRNDRFLKRLLVFGLAAGFTELLADCWLVRNTGTLIYTPGEPMLACSPFYMPFAWAVLLIQIGYLGWLISLDEKLWKSILATALIGFAVIPLFEHWAKGAGWWYYVNCKMIGNTPWYIILGEGLICSLLPVFFTQIHRRHYLLQLPMGIVQGLWIWVSYVVAFKLIG